MRYFAIIDDPDGVYDVRPELHILAEFVGAWDAEADACTRREGDPMNWNEKHCLSKGELLATDEGRRALAAWRAGDDSGHEQWERESSTLTTLHDAQERAGAEVRPDLHERFLEALRNEGNEEVDKAVAELRAAGAEALSR